MCLVIVIYNYNYIVYTFVATVTYVILLFFLAFVQVYHKKTPVPFVPFVIGEMDKGLVGFKI